MGVAGRDDVDKMLAFIETTGVGEFDHAADVDLTIWREYGIVSQPAWAFINDDGTVTTSQGALGKDGLTAQLQALIDS